MRTRRVGCVAAVLVALGVFAGACGSSDDTTVPELSAPVTTLPDPNAPVLTSKATATSRAGAAASAPVDIGVAADAASPTAFCDGLTAFRRQEQAALRIKRSQLNEFLDVARKNLDVISGAAPAELGPKLSPYVDAWRTFLTKSENDEKGGAPIPIYDKSPGVAAARVEWNRALGGC